MDAITRINQNIRQKAIQLNLSNCDLTELPIFLSSCNWLERIDISHNPKLKDISLLGKLGKIESVDISHTNVTDISVFDKMENLSRVVLNGLHIENLEPVVHCLKNGVIIVDAEIVNDNEISIRNSKISVPPPEIVRLGSKEIIKYFGKAAQEGVVKLFEAKLLLIGKGQAGKTSLRVKLKNPAAKLPDPSESTKGVDIDIEQYSFIGNENNEIKINIWDFAGQEKYHSVHQLFYTHRALYILVENAREQSTDFDDWFESVKICSDSSPVIIVHNEFGDQNRGIFNLEEYQKRYPFIKGAVRVNFLTGRGLDELKKMIHSYVQTLDHIGEVLPQSWAKIRNKLKELAKGYPYITWQDYFKICKANGINDQKSARNLSSYLHILGLMLHYAENPILSQFIILQNDWATEAVYRILEDEKIVFETKGKFVSSDLARVWKKEEYSDMLPQLLEIMKKFKICYQVRDLDMFIAPQLLPVKTPDNYIWEPSDDLQIEYQYAIMPKGLLTRFSVTQHLFIANEQTLVWKDGVVLEWRNTFAIVTEFFQEKKIKIRINGADKKGFLSIIDKTFEELHEDFEGLKKDDVETMIPCNCKFCKIDGNTPHFFKYNLLIQRQESKKYKVDCENPPFEEVDVRSLIDNVFQNSDKNKKLIPRLFISYSKDDVRQLNTFVKHLSSLKGKVMSWSDKDLKPGEEWGVAIKEKLMEADIVVYLVSHNSMSTEYIQNFELPTALERVKADKCVMVPVILDYCDWTDLEFAAFNSLPEKNYPISDKRWLNRNDAWTKVVLGIKKLIKDRFGEHNS